MKILTSITFLAATALALTANAATTDPMGGMVINLPAGSDTSFVAGFNQSVFFEGTLDSLSESEDEATLVVAGSPGFEASEFAYSDGVQDAIFRVVFLSGAREGFYYTISDNAADSLTIDLAGDSIDGLVLQGDIIQVVPYWTLDTLMADGSGITASSHPFDSSSATKVIFPDQSASSINNPLGNIYFYYDGSNEDFGFVEEGWYLDGDVFSGVKDDVIIYPDSYVVFRQPDGVSNELVLSGAVPMYNPTTIINRLVENSEQDNYVATQIPVAMTLAESNLSSTTGFLQSSHPFDSSAADKILIFNNETTGTNKPLGAIYFYYDGSNSDFGFVEEGWYLDGDVFAGKQDDVAVLQPGVGFVIRRPSGPASSIFWTSQPSYLTQ